MLVAIVILIFVGGTSRLKKTQKNTWANIYTGKTQIHHVKWNHLWVETLTSRTAVVSEFEGSMHVTLRSLVESCFGRSEFWGRNAVVSIEVEDLRCYMCVMLLYSWFVNASTFYVLCFNKATILAGLGVFVLSLVSAIAWYAACPFLRTLLQLVFVPESFGWSLHLIQIDMYTCTSLTCLLHVFETMQQGSTR